MSRTIRITALLAWLGFGATCGIGMVLAGAYLYLSPKTPEVEALKSIQLQTPLRIYSADGKLIQEFGEKKRTPVTYEEVPPLFIKAILAAEDDRFRNHSGVDPKGLIRAAKELILTGSIQTGGSTITMQVAKNYFLSAEQKFIRKFSEILLALQIERELSKEDIMALYVNKIFLGYSAYGIAAAAQVYYGKDINDLDLAQLAMIAGIPKAPSTNNPLANKKRAQIRRDWILKRMLKLGYIDEDTYLQAFLKPNTATYHGVRKELNAPYLAEMVRKELLAKFGKRLTSDGYHVYTTLDSRFQASGNEAVVAGLLAYDKKHGYRGPEFREESLQSDGNAFANDNINDVNTAALTNHINSLELRENWLETLQKIPTYFNLEAAFVRLVEEQSIVALLADGSSISVNWEGMKWARPYITQDRLGPPPKRAADILMVGDMIRVLKRADGQWELSQLPEVQGAFVALDPKNGAIKTLVGGFDFNQSQFNRVTQARRQPGSNIKPFLYACALEMQATYTAATIINDAPIVVYDPVLETRWAPKNSGDFKGPIRIREALAESRNLVSVRILQDLGASKAIRCLKKYGFESDNLKRDFTLALGNAHLTPLEIAVGYAVFANKGFKVAPFFIDRIEDMDGNIVFKHNPAVVCDADCQLRRDTQLSDQLVDEEAALLATLNDDEASLLAELESTATPVSLDSNQQDVGALLKPLTETAPTLYAEQVVDPRIVFVMDNILNDVVQRGTARRAKALNRNDLRGKTGTTNKADVWFSGYNGDLVATAWVGFDQNTPLGDRAFGSNTALPIWIDFMKVALDNQPESIMSQPEGMVWVKIDKKSGVATQNSDPENTVWEIFRRERAPKLSDTPKDIFVEDDIDELVEEDTLF